MVIVKEIFQKSTFIRVVYVDLSFGWRELGIRTCGKHRGNWWIK